MCRGGRINLLFIEKTEDEADFSPEVLDVERDKVEETLGDAKEAFE